MVDVVHEPIDDEQAEMHIWPPADFCGFGLEHPFSNFFAWVPLSKLNEVKSTTYEREIHFTL